MMKVGIVSCLPAGTVRRIIKDIWWKVGLRLPVQDQVLQRLHPADLLVVEVHHRRAVLRDSLTGARPGPVPASARTAQLCNRRRVSSGQLSVLSPLELSLAWGGGTRWSPVRQ